jgi:hypothetical protein
MEHLGRPAVNAYVKQPCAREKSRHLVQLNRLKEDLHEFARHVKVIEVRSIDASSVVTLDDLLDWENDVRLRYL